MKKKFLFCLILSALFLSSTLCCAESDIKNSFRRELINSCMEGFYNSSDGSVPPSFGVKYCQCVVDEVLAKYSVAELIALEDYDENTIRFMEDMENAIPQCVKKILN